MSILNLDYHYAPIHMYFKMLKGCYFFFAFYQKCLTASYPNVKILERNSISIACAITVPAIACVIVHNDRKRLL